MNTFKHAVTVIALCAAGMVSTQAYAVEAAARTAQTSQKLSTFSQDDINGMFETKGKPMQLAALSKKEMKDTEGAFVNFAVGAGLGAGGYLLDKWWSGDDITWQGLAFNTAVGAVTGGVGGRLASAAGGGIVGAVAWEPPMAAIDYSAGLYTDWREW